MVNKPVEIPIFASIDWTKKEQWEFLDIKTGDMGGANGRRLIMEYAEKQGVILEYLEYEKFTRFYVLKPKKQPKIKQREYGSDIIFLSDAVLKTIEEAKPYSVSNQALRREHDNIAYAKYKKIMDYLVDKGKVEVELDRGEGQKGRPSKSYTWKG